MGVSGGENVRRPYHYFHRNREVVSETPSKFQPVSAILTALLLRSLIPSSTSFFSSSQLHHSSKKPKLNQQSNASSKSNKLIIEGSR